MVNYFKYYEDKIIDGLKDKLSVPVEKFPDEPEKYVLKSNVAILVQFAGSSLQEEVIDILNYKIFVLVKDMRKTGNDYEDLAEIKTAVESMDKDGILIAYKSISEPIHYENKWIFEINYYITHYRG